VQGRNDWLLSAAGEQLLRDGLWTGRVASEEELAAIAGGLGEPIPARSTAPVVQDLMPLEVVSAPKKSLSALHGVGSFPFHTDGAHHRQPPRWVVMRCVDPGPANRPTLLVDGAQLPLTSRQWREVERAVWWVRSGGRSFPASIVKRKEGALFRYDRGCMTAAHRAFGAAGDLLEAAIEASDHVCLSWRPHDVIVFDNWRMLHARGTACGSDTGVRRLQRILVR
jgi:alpha-ketoglutarate-dependent taurine dioxygenase